MYVQTKRDLPIAAGGSWPSFDIISCFSLAPAKSRWLTDGADPGDAMAESGVQLEDAASGAQAWTWAGFCTRDGSVRQAAWPFFWVLCLSQSRRSVRQPGSLFSRPKPLSGFPVREVKWEILLPPTRSLGTRIQLTQPLKLNQRQQRAWHLATWGPPASGNSTVPPLSCPGPGNIHRSHESQWSTGLGGDGIPSAVMYLTGVQMRIWPLH